MTYADLPELRTLMLGASFGGGHHQANRAIADAMRALDPRVHPESGDFIAYMRPHERLITLGLYSYWLKHSPETYRRFYNWTDSEREPKAITNTFHWLGLGGMKRDLARIEPHLVVCSFPTTAALSDTARRRTGRTYLNALIVTDYRAHHHWARTEADLLLVARDSGKAELMHWGVPEERIFVTGIPILPRFGALYGHDPRALRAQFGLHPDQPLILVSGGATGTYRAFQTLARVFGNLGTRVQALILASNDRPGVERIGGATIHHLPYTPNFPELLAASDIVVGKAGGLTVAETLALGKPTVVFEPIPGQEEHNARLLEQHGAGVWARSETQLHAALSTLVHDPAARAHMGHCARRIAQPDAAQAAARVLLDGLKRHLG
ncbi:MGDG synthase family glycosyltransferase [Deinococcus maricopensis]|uniref:Monogalactosyldiacylglycerol synthase n=1 Tax=Deinococcus maricopensis (strain DSM 21211 / LMG 22137 / NRRL B-23946 / LB-34) TaxID=709986 RepID=E8UBS0_DEIML|nr:glycosyltransferase [Deinococcus maricopensis]ADV68509.1 Monogalactosyldiacylglycerol synthase [Deinococcus maricopensis DSM 21211]